MFGSFLNFARQLWRDEAGYALSAEAVVLGTVGVTAAAVGFNSVAYSVDRELEDMAFSLRSLDQSYCYQGFRGQGAWTAGSTFAQQPVEEAHAELRQYIEDQERQLEKLKSQELQREQQEPAAQPKPSRERNKDDREDDDDDDRPSSRDKQKQKSKPDSRRSKDKDDSRSEATQSRWDANI